MTSSYPVPMLFPVEPEQFWQQMRLIIREEIAVQGKEKVVTAFETFGLTYKPLYKMREVCDLLQVSRPTLYEWIREGLLKPYKIKSRVYFLYDDIVRILRPANVFK